MEEQQTAEQAKSIWGNLPNGEACKIPILVVAGGKATAKTSTLGTIAPELTIAIDLEDSSETYSFPFLRRFSLFDHLAKLGKKDVKPIDVFLFVKEILESEEKLAGAKVITIDPASDFSQGLFDYIIANAAEFGVSGGQVDKMTGLVWGKAKSYLKTMLGMLSKKHGIETVGIALHTGQVWRDGKPTRAEKAKGVDTFYELASLFLWLQRPDPSKEVIDAITVPPLAKSRIAVPLQDADGEWRMQSCFPPKIGGFSVKKLRQYISSPPNWAKLKASEKYQPEAMTEETKLELQSEIASANVEAERLKLERIARAEAAANRTKPKVAKAEPAKAVEPEHPTANQSPPASTSAAEPTTNGEQTATTVAPATVRKITDEQVTELKRLKAIVKPTDAQWLKVLDKYGVKTARDMDEESADQLILYMTDFAARIEGESERTRWAKSALPGKQ